MSWSKEQIDAYIEMLKSETAIQRLLREAKEAESSAEWYLDADSEIKAYHFYHGAGQQFSLAVAYSLGLISGFTIDQVNEQRARAEEEEYQKERDNEA